MTDTQKPGERQAASGRKLRTLGLLGLLILGLPGGYLGLAIARQLMQRQGGRLTLHQNEPSGLIVRLAQPQPKGRPG